MTLGLNNYDIWRLPLNRPCAAAMRHFVKITLTTW